FWRSPSSLSAPPSIYRERGDMMPDGTVRLTSPGHPAAVFTYLTGAFIGAITITGLAEAKSMTDIAGSDLVLVWASIATAAGLLAAAMGLIDRGEPPSYSRLRIEFVSSAVLSLSFLGYVITSVVCNALCSLLISYGLATGMFLGAAACAVEILFEVRRVRIGSKVGE